MSKACMICGVKCTTCGGRGGKCNCGYTEAQKQLSNLVITELGLTDWRRGLLPELILSGKSDIEIKESIINPSVDDNVKTSLVKRYDKPLDKSNLRCKYESNGVMARCILCGEIRFYKRGEPCSVKLGQ